MKGIQITIAIVAMWMALPLVAIAMSGSHNIDGTMMGMSFFAMMGSILICLFTD